MQGRERTFRGRARVTAGRETLFAHDCTMGSFPRTSQSLVESGMSLRGDRGLWAHLSCAPEAATTRPGAHRVLKRSLPLWS